MTGSVIILTYSAKCLVIVPMQPRVLLDLDLGARDRDAVVHGIHRYASERGRWQLVPTGMLGDRWKEIATPDQIDGCLGTIGHNALSLYKRGIPCISIWSTSELPEQAKVFTDPVAWARLVDEHFSSIGRTTIAMVLQGGAGTRGPRMRRDALRHHLREQRRKLITSTIAATTSHELLAELHTWLVGLPKPVAVVAAQDELGWWVCEACRRADLRVPHDVAVLGSNHRSAIADLCTPPMSSVAYDHEQCGYRAAELLDKLMQGKSLPREPIRIEPLGIVARESTRPSADRDPLVEQALRMIEDHMEEGLSVGDLVDALPAGERTLQRRFLAELGRTPGQVLRAQRVEKAKRLLATTTLSITEIAVRCGFGHASQLSREVKSAVGVSPLAYRARQRG